LDGAPHLPQLADVGLEHQSNYPTLANCRRTWGTKQKDSSIKPRAARSGTVSRDAEVLRPTQANRRLEWATRERLI